MLFAITVLVIALVGVAFISHSKPKKKKYIIWGITTMVVIAPLFSWLVGMIYGISEGSGFAAMGVMVIMFPIIFIIGLVILLKGIYTLN